MKVYNYHLMSDPFSELYYEFNEVKLKHNNKLPYPVALGIDASSTKTGVVIGRIDADAPLAFIEMVREKDESIRNYLNNVIDFIVYEILMGNNLEAKYIFTEDKYEDKNKYSRAVLDALASVKTALKDLPHEITRNQGTKKPEYHLMLPQQWRKFYLGDLNTNKGRAVMKQIVASYGMKKYGLHPQCSKMDDIMDALGIYSAGIITVVKPESATTTVAEVIPTDIEWGHKLKQMALYTTYTEDLVPNLLRITPEIKSRVDEYGFKLFNYHKGMSLEKNLRCLTSSSNGLFITFLKPSDLDAVPIFYRLKKIPREGEIVVAMGLRENIKGGL